MQRSTLARLALPILVTALAVAAPGCGDGKKGGGANGGSGGEDASAQSGPYDGMTADQLIAKYEDVLDIPMVRYEWDPNAGDPSVSAEDGGPGFTGEGWTTNLEYPAVGSSEAVPGGSLKTYLLDWPATLRLQGENWNSTFNFMVANLCQDALIGIHSQTLEFVPNVASHWWISEDKETYRFRINPQAKWHDGSPITAHDVVATWKLLTNPDIRFPSTTYTFNKFHEPVAKSKYIVEVKVKEENWRNFQYFGGMALFKAEDVTIPGEEFLKKYNNAYPTLSGPYSVNVDDINVGNSLTISRDHRWWGEGRAENVGLYNLEKYVYEIVKDPNLAFEKAKKGELDLYVVPKARWWAEEIPEIDAVNRGLLVMKKLYTDAPIGVNGLAINVKKPPLDDLRVRQALQHLTNIDLFIEKLFFNEYERLTSYFQGGTYSNPANQPLEYDPVRAVELLEEAGYTELNDELYRMKDGKVLELELSYASALSEPYLTIFQEDCKKAGIRLNLARLDPAARWKAATSKQFQLTSQAWGGLTFPNPETSFHSRLADKPGNNNLSAYANPRVDELCEAYDREYDQQKRVAIIREIDGILFADRPYVLHWYNPAQRFLYWNKFRMPPWGCARTQDTDDMHFTWWVDPELEKQLEAARKSPTATMEKPEQKNRFWQAWNLRKRRQEEGGN